MGRYTLKLLEALDKEVIDITLIFNKTINWDPARLKVIDAVCPSANKFYVVLPDDPASFGGWQKLQMVCADRLDKQLSKLIQPEDTYLIASNFALKYCSTFPNLSCNKAVIFYDLTPYLQWDEYKHTPDFEPQKYFAQFMTLFRADQLWAISQSAADEAKYWLGIDEKKVFNIRGASIRDLNAETKRPDNLAASKYILSPSADGPNKNNENMVRAFARFNEQNGDEYKLVITSNFSDQSKRRLGEISKDIIFTDHVSDNELGWLYSHCVAILFVSKREGLGLPILEAVGANKKVICSNIKVFKEISEDAFYFADPASVQSIADALNDALVLGERWDDKSSRYSDITSLYSWESVAQTCLELINSQADHNISDKYPSQNTIWYADTDKHSPARDIAEMLYPLNPENEFRAMRSTDYTYNAPSYLPEMGVARNALAINKTAGARPIYIIDNSLEAARILLYAIQYPGVIIAVFAETDSPGGIEKYLKETVSSNLTWKEIIRLIIDAGSKVVYRPKFPKRGTPQFIDEVSLLEREVIRREI